MEQAPDFITVIREYFRNGTLQQITKTHRIVSLEDDQEAVYYISSGYVRIYSNNKRGEQSTQIIYGPGEIFPLTWLSKYPRTHAYYEAMTDCEIYCQPLDQVTKDLINVKGLAYGLLQQAVEQYRVFTLRVNNLEFKYASERLAYRLILLANRFGEHSGDGVTIIPAMTHQQLGSSLNLSRESISREMEKLMRAGLVRYNASRQIVITNVAELAEQAHVPSHQGLS